MIKNEFYATDMTFQPDIELTKVLNQLKDSSDTTDITNAYYIGYLDPMYETNPKTIETAESSVSTLAEITIKATKQKIPWGWCFNYNFNSGAYATRKNCYVLESQMNSNAGNIGSSRLINSLKTPKLTMWANVSFSMRIIQKSVLQWVSPVDGTGQQTGAKNSDVHVSVKQLSNLEFIEFMSGTSITVPVTGLSDAIFSSKNWNESLRAFETDEYLIYISTFFIGYGDTTQLTIKGEYPAGTGLNYIVPFVKNSLGQNNLYKFANYWDTGYIAIETLHDNPTDCTPGVYPYFRGFQAVHMNEGTSIIGTRSIASYEVNLNSGDLNWVYTNKKPGNIDYYIAPSGGLFYIGGYYGQAGNNYVRLEYSGSYSPDFINQCFCLLNKAGTPTDIYTTVDNTTPAFTQGGRPEGIAKLSIFQIPVLQPWQTGDIQDSEFDPEDMPDEDGDDDRPEENPVYPEKRDIPPDDNFPDLHGVDTANIAMTKFYVLTDSGMDYLRTALATSWDETDETNFWYKLGEVETAAGEPTIKIAAKSQDIKNYVVSCRVYPGDLSEFCSSETVAGIPFGYQGAAITAISRKNMDLVYKSLNNMGHIEIKNRQGTTKLQDISYLDFEPFTQAKIYLPFCGCFPVSMLDILCTKMYITYTYNFSTGEILYTVNVAGGVATNGSSKKMILQRTGVLGIGCSITGNDIVSQGDTIAAATINKWTAESNARIAMDSMLTAPLNQGAGLAGTINKNSGGGAMGYAGIAAGTYNTAVGITTAYEHMLQAMNSETNANISMMQASRDIPFNLGFGNSSSAGVQQSAIPYVEIDRPLIIENGAYHTETFGRPWYRATKIGDIHGYLKCVSPIIENISNGGTSATEIEMQEISTLLRGGVYNA